MFSPLPIPPRSSPPPSNPNFMLLFLSLSKTNKKNKRTKTKNQKITHRKKSTKTEIKINNQKLIRKKCPKKVKQDKRSLPKCH